LRCLAICVAAGRAAACTAARGKSVVSVRCTSSRPIRKVLGARSMRRDSGTGAARYTGGGEKRRSLASYGDRSCGGLLRAGARAAPLRSAAQRRHVVSISAREECRSVVRCCEGSIRLSRRRRKFINNNTQHPSAAHARVWRATFSTGGVTGVCDVMSGRGWCHKCVALGCHGPAQTPVNGRAARMRVRPTTAAPPRLPAGGWGSSIEAMAALRGVSCAPVPTQAHRRTRSGAAGERA
jgi:hypothetical protein